MNYGRYYISETNTPSSTIKTAIVNFFKKINKLNLTVQKQIYYVLKLTSIFCKNFR